MLNRKVLEFTSCLIFTVLAASSNSVETDKNKCPSQFPTTCSCGLLEMTKYEQSLLAFYGKLVVNCTGTKLTHVSILKSTPDWTQVLIFRGNNFPELPGDTFAHTDQSSSLETFIFLETIDLSNNSITFIHPDAFESMKNVKKLILDHNKLLVTGDKFTGGIFSHFQSLQDLSLKGAFDRQQRTSDFIGILTSSLFESKLTNLTYLALNENSLPNIHDEKSFCSFSSLRELSLAGNSLTRITFIVSCMPNLTYLDLSDNYISNVDSTAITNLFNQSDLQVNLVRNPLRCDCHILPFHRWLLKSKKTIQVIGESTLKCASGDPESNIDKLFASLGEEDFHCSPQSLIQDEESTLGFSVTIGVILSSLLITSLFVMLRRASVVQLYNRVLDSITGGQEYTCLDQDNLVPSGNLFIQYHGRASLNQQSIAESHELIPSMREDSM